MGALEKTRQELDATKLRLSSTQQSLHERDGHLNSMHQERRKQLEEILEMKLVSHDPVWLNMWSIHYIFCHLLNVHLSAIYPTQLFLEIETCTV